jgi:outer membrane protein, heavy metal efflux system
MGKAKIWRAGTALLSLCVAGCAHYAPAPLHAPADVLAPPDPALLSADGARIERPYLTPLAIDLTQPLTPNAIAVIAVIENPDLKALRAKTGVTDAQSFAARLLPDPSFQAGFDKLLHGPDDMNGLAGQLGFDLAALRTAEVVRQNGASLNRQVRLDLAWAEWQTAGQARLQGVRLAALEAQLPLAQASAASAEHWLAVAERAAGRGDVAATEVETRRQAALDATDKLRTAERDLTTARGELNKLLGLPPGAMLRIAPATTVPMTLSATALTAQALAYRLDLAALRSGYDAAEADVHKAILDQFPTLSLTLAAARDTAGNVTLGPQVGFSLPLWNRNRGGIATATATREQLRAEYDARLFQTRADIADAVATLELARRQRATLAAQLPAIDHFASVSANAAQHGDLSPATAEAAAQTLRDRRLALGQLDQAADEATIALELLTGTLSEGWTR